MLFSSFLARAPITNTIMMGLNFWNTLNENFRIIVITVRFPRFVRTKINIRVEFEINERVAVYGDKIGRVNIFKWSFDTR